MLDITRMEDSSCAKKTKLRVSVKLSALS